MDRELWLQFRRKGIGGSDVAAIAGLSKWKFTVAVYLEKIGQTPLEDVQSEAAHFGSILEDVVAQEFTLRTGLKVKRRNAILQHSDYPFMLANVDRLIVGERTGLECKTASEYLKHEWEGEEIPPQYLIQCQHYMAVTGYTAWWIAVLIGGNKFIYKRIERDDEIIQYLINLESEFWNNHVLTKIPPMVDGSEASTALLRNMYPVGESESETELPLEADVILEQLEQAKQDEKVAIDRVTELENRLKAMLGEIETGIASKHIVSWKNMTTHRIDSKALAKDHPDIYQKYLKPSVSRRFGVKTV
ncbi:YqaJ viral recombinase family protein [Brevibacillus choshinensis]|uniref:YqaJ viral recombinase family protein n=1 Tax=Brevibacillus choshinensis TaxID=54911 RepID=A0ABX7FXU2_BRECH|nr:YqaJ viral recombinase family protein [Brevibacillus choshinensis]QRG70634.1 YqaJ viral recombinase family protein [Brevibacillus choshinensis]